jgi:GST-like protein
MGGVGPMFGQANHFSNYAPEKIPYAIDRYVNECKRLYGVIDRRLGEAEYLAGDYSIADIATFSWTRSYEQRGIEAAEFPNFIRWHEAIDARPAVKAGLEVMSEYRRTGPPDKETLENFFGAKQYARH